MPSNTPPQNGNAQTPAQQFGNGQEDVEAERQRRSRENLRASRKKLNAESRQAGETRRKLDRANEALVRLENGHDHFDDLSSAALLFGVVTGLLPVAIYCLDVFLLSQVSQYISDLSGDLLHGWLAAMGTLFVPALIVWAEITLSHQRTAAAAEASQFGDLARSKDRAAYWMWTVLSVLVALSIPAMVGTMLLAQDAAGLRLAEISWKKFGPMGGVVALSFGFHAMLVFSGAAAHTGQAYIAYRLRHRRRRRKDQRLQKRYTSICEQIAQLFDEHEREHERCNRLHPDEDIPLGPFSMAVREALNDHYGYEFIAVPDTPEDESDGAAPSPAPESDDPDDPEGSGSSTSPVPEAGDAPSGDGAMPPEPPPAAPSPAEPTAPREDDQTDDADESQAVAGYYRNMAEARRRDADGEIGL